MPANVSELAAAIRVCNLAEEIGLLNASVVLFDGDSVKWQWSRTLRMPEDTAQQLLKATRSVSPEVFSYQREAGDVIVASIIDNPFFGSATLFVQLLPGDLGMQASHHETRKLLEDYLFTGDQKLRKKVSGLMGSHKPRVVGLSRSAAIELLWERNKAKLHGSKMLTQRGKEYVELRISEWC